MVLEGQYLERPTLIARVPATETDPGVTLEGLYHRGPKAPALVVCAPHPRLGGSMDSPVVAELAWAFTRKGHATLRFNYQGVGASGGEVHAAPPGFDGPQPLSVLDSEVADAAAALRHLGESVEHGRLAVAGYSFGAAVALRLALEDARISHLVLVAPPTSLFDFSALTTLSRPVFLGVGQKDAGVDRPLLTRLIDGKSEAHVEVLGGADHVFTRGLTELGRAASEWLAHSARAR